MSGNRNKKNNKKSKSLNLPEVLQVKSVKLDTAKSNQESGKQSAKSDDNLRKRRKFNILKNAHNEESLSEGGSQMDSSLMKKFKTLTLANEGESSVPGTSLVSSLEEPNIDVKKSNEDDIPLVMEYCPEPPQENFDDLSSYKYPKGSKSSKSIKFTNQVTVLYFNGEDILCESMEPLKKEQDQQLRNKEMRKEHLMSKGPIDNLYLF